MIVGTFPSHEILLVDYYYFEVHALVLYGYTHAHLFR
jgi:hypothetical protein